MARLPARLGVMRLGASRLNDVQPVVHVTIDGAVRDVRVSDCKINQNVNGTSNASLTVDGFTPVPGHSIVIAIGDTDAAHQEFGGRITSVTARQDGGASGEVAAASHTVYDLVCQDFNWELNRRKVMATWSTSISTIVADLLSTWTVDFPGPHDIEAGLPSVSEFTATNADVTEVLDRLAVLAGGARWWVAPSKIFHFTTAAADGATTPLTDGMVGYGIRNVRFSSSNLGRAPWAFARGGGGVALVPVPVSATSIPVDDASWYPNATEDQTSVEPYYDSRVESGTQRLTFATVNKIPTTVAIPAGGNSAGDTTIIVGNISPASLGFPSAGWCCVGGVYFHYTSIQFNSFGNFYYFSGVPASGYGGLATDIEPGAVICAVASLEGVSATTQAIPAGQIVNILYRARSDANMTALQTALDGSSINSGRFESFVSDGRWGYVETRTRAVAMVLLNQGAHEELTFDTHDQTFRVGREVAADLTYPPVDGTYRIQSVNLDGIGAGGAKRPMHALRRVVASSQRRSLDNTLRLIRRLEERP